MLVIPVCLQRAFREPLDRLTFAKRAAILRRTRISVETASEKLIGMMLRDVRVETKSAYDNAALVAPPTPGLGLEDSGAPEPGQCDVLQVLRAFGDKASCGRPVSQARRDASLQSDLA